MIRDTENGTEDIYFSRTVANTIQLNASYKLFA